MWQCCIVEKIGSAKLSTFWTMPDMTTMFNKEWGIVQNMDFQDLSSEESNTQTNYNFHMLSSYQSIRRNVFDHQVRCFLFQLV